MNWSFKDSNKQIPYKFLNKLEEKVKILNSSLSLIDFPYFLFLNELPEDKFNLFITPFLTKIHTFLYSTDLPVEYILDFISQSILERYVRHGAGEYYTPSFLVKEMIDKSYEVGEKVVDPCCGSGNFLIEIIKRIKSFSLTQNQKFEAISNIYGFDINPLAIYMTKINFLCLLGDKIKHVSFNLDCLDILTIDFNHTDMSFDLIIGNPPWYTYRDREDQEYQMLLKNIAETYNIKPLPKNILNIEIATIIFSKVVSELLCEGGEIFFVMTKGILTGSHASRFRNFRGLEEIVIWMFEPQIEQIFNIEFVCLFAKKGKNTNKKRFQGEITALIYELHNSNTELTYFSDVSMVIKSNEILIPYGMSKSNDKTYTKRLIFKHQKHELLPTQESIYKKRFHKGADLNPRNLIFVTQKPFKEGLTKINPDPRVFKRAKAPWKKKEYKDEIIELKYLHKVVKSTELVKFYVYDNYCVFLPFEKIDFEYNYESLEPNAKNFYDKINMLYLKYKKTTTKNKSLVENLNRWSKLCNKRQQASIKVAYNNSGSILNAAVIIGNILVTGDLSFYHTKEVNEAYYLSAILNSNLLTNQIKIVKSSRHIFKLPFEFPIPKYEKENNVHQTLSTLGKEGEEYVRNYINTLMEKKKKISKRSIQIALEPKLSPILGKIDSLVKDLFF